MPRPRKASPTKNKKGSPKGSFQTKLSPATRKTRNQAKTVDCDTEDEVKLIPEELSDADPTADGDSAPKVTPIDCKTTNNTQEEHTKGQQIKLHAADDKKSGDKITCRKTITGATGSNIRHHRTTEPHSDQDAKTSPVRESLKRKAKSPDTKYNYSKTKANTSMGKSQSKQLHITDFLCGSKKQKKTDCAEEEEYTISIKSQPKENTDPEIDNKDNLVCPEISENNTTEQKNSLSENSTTKQEPSACTDSVQVEKQPDEQQVGEESDRSLEHQPTKINGSSSSEQQTSKEDSENGNVQEVHEPKSTDKDIKHGGDHPDKHGEGLQNGHGGGQQDKQQEPVKDNHDNLKGEGDISPENKQEHVEDGSKVHLEQGDKHSLPEEERGEMDSKEPERQKEDNCPDPEDHDSDSVQTDKKPLTSEILSEELPKESISLLAQEADHTSKDQVLASSNVEITPDEDPPVPGSNLSDPDTDTEMTSEPDTQKTDDYSLDQDESGEKSDKHQKLPTKKDHELSDNEEEEKIVPDFDSDSQEKWLFEAEKPKKTNVPGPSKKAFKPRMVSKWSDSDTQEYRDGYPGKKDNKSMNSNLKFYQNKISSQPDGGTIDEIHENWWGDYRRLEIHHGYIQWLFPIREKGMNFQSQELQLFEAEAIKNDPKAKRRVLKSYEMMLDFYGIRLVDSHHGKMERAENWKERFAHLNRSFHNYLRITRILKALGELGYEYLKVKFLEFMMNEAFVERTLPNCQTSCLNYWIHTLRVDDERHRLVDLVDNFDIIPQSRW